MEDGTGNAPVVKEEITDPQNQNVPSEDGQTKTEPVVEDPQVVAPVKTADTKGAEPSGAEKRIKQLVAEKRAREREIEQLKSELSEKGTVQDPKTQSPQTVDGLPLKPTPDKYTDYDEYLSDLGAWKVEVRTIQKKRDDDLKAQREKAKRTEDEFHQRLIEDSAENPDILDLRDRVGRKVTPPIAIAVKASEIPADLIRYLDANPKELERLSQLDYIAAAREIGKIEVKLAEPSSKKVVSGAPPPVNIEKKNSGTVITHKNEDELPMEDYMAKFRNRGKK